MVPTVSAAVLAAACALSIAGTAVFAAPPTYYPSPGGLAYPPARRMNLTEDYFGTPVEDPYRWMEDPFSKETIKFASQQSDLSLKYIKSLPDRELFKRSFREINRFDRYGTPFKKGEYWYYFANLQGQNAQSILYRTKDLQDKKPEIFLDPNTLSPQGVDRVDSWVFSPDLSKFAYLVTKNETDYSWVGFVDVKSRKPFDTFLRYVIRSMDPYYFRWASDGTGVTYARYKTPKGLSWDDAGRNNDLFPDQYDLYFHKFGTSIGTDKVCEASVCPGALSFAPERPETPKFAIVDDGKGGKIRIALPVKKQSVFTPWASSVDTPEFEWGSTKQGAGPFDTTFVGTAGGMSYYRTDAGAPRGKVIAIPDAEGEELRAVDVVPQDKELILDQSVQIADGALAVFYLDNVKHVVRVVKVTNGTSSTIYEFPHRNGAATDIKADTALQMVTFKYENMIDPGTIYIYNLSSNNVTVFRKLQAPAAVSQVVFDQVFFNSKDGTRVPAFVVRPKDARKNGRNPVWMYGYGGFQINIMPTFSAFAVALARHYGGIYALVNIRGGKEYGSPWYEGGSLFNKQNCFDDIISAGKFFVKEGWTREGLLSIHGGSNGGLLAGAVSVQAPGLIGVGLADYGVHETLRFTNFTFGPGWVDDYGRNFVGQEVLSALKWAPVYNVKPNVRYPAMLITTGDHDTRVSPLHSFKFAAHLQRVSHSVWGAKPVLLRIRELSGHNIFSLLRYMDTMTDKVTFWAQQLRVPYRP
ncbi:hypothetical protein SpCBS45565_g06317 [Spizellomyces sp. 'palustris']|nr:hypothetical protein SpCBS45565_g06317 [Spizellomyces sp. 'palustris']